MLHENSIIYTVLNVQYNTITKAYRYRCLEKQQKNAKITLAFSDFWGLLLFYKFAVVYFFPIIYSDNIHSIVEFAEIYVVFAQFLF